MKVRNIVRGAVVALSLGLASVGTGMGLTASHTNVSQHVGLATATNSNTSLKPNLICEPGGTCGTPQYFENTKTVDGYTGYNQVEYVGSRTAAGGSGLCGR